MSHTSLPASDLRGNAFAARLLLILFLGCLHQAVLNTTHAANLCAESAAQLQTHLDTADSNSQDDTIQITTGQHMVSEFMYFGSANNEDFDLTISGGWTEFFGNPCGQQLSASAFDTVLNGSSGGRIITLS